VGFLNVSALTHVRNKTSSMAADFARHLFMLKARDRTTELDLVFMQKTIFNLDIDFVNVTCQPPRDFLN
jgi:hypothetical protein